MSNGGINWLGIIVGVILLLIGIGLTIWGSGYADPAHPTTFNVYAFFFGIALGFSGMFVLGKSN